MAGTFKDQLVDVALVRLQLAESKSKSGNTLVRGEFASYDRPTQNKRYYPEAVWKKEMKRLDEAMKDRRVFGELDHPSDGRTSLKRVSHIVTGMKLENGILIGEAEILPTKEGQQLEALLKSGCKVGVSSRGFGSVKTNDEGVDVVQEDYKLVTFDFVADPADSTAYPEAVFEGVEFPMADQLDENDRQDSDIRRHAKDDAEKAAEWARKLEAGEFDKEESKDLPAELLNKLAEMRDEVREQVRGELLSDPKVAGAVVALENMKELLRPFVLPEDAKVVAEQKDSEIASLKKQLAEKDLQLKELEEERDKLTKVAKEAAYKFYLERALKEDPDAELIRNLIGDVKQFASSEELKARVEAVREELNEKREEEKAAKEALATEAAKTQELIQSVQEEASKKVATLEEALEKLAATNKELALRLYTEKKLRTHSRSAKIRSLIESSNVDSKDDVDNLIAEYSAPDPHDSDEAGDLRSRIRRRLRTNTREADHIQEESRRDPHNGDSIHGVPMSELQSLSGIARGR